MTGDDKRQFTDEELMAFADGEADPALRSALAAALERDPVLSERVETFRATARSLKNAFPPLDDSKADQRILAAMQKALHAEAAEVRLEPNVIAFPAHRAVSQVPWRAAAAAVAACLVLGIGLAAGFLAAQHSRPAIQQAAIGAAMAAAFEKQASGASVQLEDGTLALIATYRSMDGKLCREYELESAAAGKATGLACASANGWRVAAQVFSESDGGGYAPAGGVELMDALIARTGLTGPLTEAEEAAVLGK